MNTTLEDDELERLLCDGLVGRNAGHKAWLLLFIRLGWKDRVAITVFYFEEIEVRLIEIYNSEQMSEVFNNGYCC